MMQPQAVCLQRHVVDMNKQLEFYSHIYLVALNIIDWDTSNVLTGSSQPLFMSVYYVYC